MIDQRIDTTGKLAKQLFFVFDAPEYVKTASLGQIHGKNAKCAMDYADPVRKQFPICNRAAIWTSAAYLYASQKDPDPAIEARIKEAADLFEITSDIETLKQSIKKAKEVKQTYVDDCFAVVLDIGGLKVRRYPLRSGAEVKAAAAYFERYRHELSPWVIRREFARRVLEKAAEYKVDISEHLPILRRSAGLGCSMPTELVGLIVDRASKLGRRDKELSHTMLKAASIMADLGDVSMEAHDAVMDLIDLVDQKLKLATKYAQIGFPEDVVYSTSKEAVASLASDVVVNSKTGRIYSLSDVLAVSPKTLSKYLGAGFVKLAHDPDAGQPEAERLTKALSRLSDGDARVFDALMNRAGVKPMAVRPTSIGLSQDELESLSQFATERV